MRKFYGEPEILLIKMSAEDVITTSGITNTDGGVNKEENDPFDVINTTI